MRRDGILSQVADPRKPRNKSRGFLASRPVRFLRVKNPFDHYAPGSKHIHWVKPELVADVKFSAWREGGRLRHPVYVGLRDDKSPRQVRREMAKRGQRNVR